MPRPLPHERLHGEPTHLDILDRLDEILEVLKRIESRH